MFPYQKWEKPQRNFWSFRTFLAGMFMVLHVCLRLSLSLSLLLSLFWTHCWSDDLFPIIFISFLQSLEALQDGEHEKQRRHFLYFLLHQVPVSSNFSILMRKKASQVASYLPWHLSYNMLFFGSCNISLKFFPFSCLCRLLFSLFSVVTGWILLVHLLNARTCGTSLWNMSGCFIIDA